MHLRLIYLYRNLTRNPLRTCLTCAAVGLPMVIYVLSSAVIVGMEKFLDNSAKQLRLAVAHKASIVNPLPDGYARKIQSLDPTGTRLTAVCGMRWIGGKIENDPRLVSTVAVDAEPFVNAFPDYQLTPAEKDAWLKDRQAIILGRGTAAQFGWNVGDRITLRPSLPPYTPMEFHVVSTADKATDPLTNWCHRTYFEEELKKQYPEAPQNMVSFFFIKCASRQDLDRFRIQIDDLFKGSIDETKTQDEKAFMNEYITQQFNLPRNLAILSAVTVFVAIMAATNTMSMNFRDRFNEYATLKAIGFGGGYVFSLIQTESLGLCLVGGAIGALAPYAAFRFTPLRNVTVPLIQHLEIQPIVCAYAIGIAGAIGVIAAVWPAVQAFRMKVVTALRNLE